MPFTTLSAVNLQGSGANLVAITGLVFVIFAMSPISSSLFPNPYTCLTEGFYTKPPLLLFKTPGMAAVKVDAGHQQGIDSYDPHHGGVDSVYTKLIFRL